MAKKIKQPKMYGIANVPVVMQLEALECGAACLTMIMAYYGLWIPLERVRSDCGVSRDGSNAANVLKAARKYGFIAKAYRSPIDALKKDAGFPCIIHWNFCHYVVLCGFKKDKAVLCDPARGRVEVSAEEFDKSFTGIVLRFSPDENFVPQGKPRSLASYAKKLLKGTGAAIAFTVFVSICAMFFSIINPVASRMFIDRFIGKGNSNESAVFLAVLSFLSIIQIFISSIQAVYQLKINGKMAVVGDTTFMWKVLRMPMDFFSQRMSGDIQMRQADNGQIVSVLVTIVGPMAINAFMMIFYLVIMVRYNLILSIIGISSVLINLIVSNIITAKRINISRVQLRDEGKLASYTVSGIEMIETIKASGAEDGFFSKWAGYQASANTQSVRFAKLNQMLEVIPGIVSGVSGIIVLCMGVFFTFSGEFTVGMLMAFQGYLNLFTAPAQSFITFGQEIQQMRVRLERIEDVMEYPEEKWKEIDPSQTEDIGKLKGEVEIKNLSFGYSRLGNPIIEDLNLHLKPGKSIALVGSSGSGKSTIAKLVSNLYKPWSGEILFDGVPLEEIPREVRTASIGVIDQDIILFEGTVAENIKMWDNSIQDFEMILAARDADLHEIIVKRDGGYNYKITEGGKDFSGGQRQRIEIARVLAQDPTIIIMDEATSALDALTEYKVVQSIRDRGVSMIIVAHRLSTIRDCDEIIVLDKGKVVERGTHDELYAKGGYYAELISNE